MTYKESCEERLRRLESQSLETVFLPFVKYIQSIVLVCMLRNSCMLLMYRKDSLLPFHKGQLSASVLHQFLLDVCESYRVDKKTSAGNRIESFGISLIAGLCVLLFVLLMIIAC